jgi:hypothetical protein
VERSPDCFLAIAQTFKHSRHSLGEFLDKNLEHFAVVCVIKRMLLIPKLISRTLTWKGPMGPVSAAMKLCILEPGFNTPSG